jgi:hypothetical protein
VLRFIDGVCQIAAKGVAKDKPKPGRTMLFNHPASRHGQMKSQVSGIALLLLLSLAWASTASAARFGILTERLLNKKQKYTSLVFFKVPKDVIPECDAMERIVRQAEQEVGLRVERMDIVRIPAAAAISTS